MLKLLHCGRQLSNVLVYTSWDQLPIWVIIARNGTQYPKGPGYKFNMQKKKLISYFLHKSAQISYKCNNFWLVCLSFRPQFVRLIPNKFWIYWGNNLPKSRVRKNLFTKTGYIYNLFLKWIDHIFSKNINFLLWGAL